MERIQELVSAAFDARRDGYMVRWNRHNLKKEAGDGLTRTEWEEYHDADKEEKIAQKQAGAARTDLAFAEAHGAKADEYFSDTIRRGAKSLTEKQKMEAEVERLLAEEIPLALPEERYELQSKAKRLKADADSYKEETNAWIGERDAWKAVQKHMGTPDGNE